MFTGIIEELGTVRAVIPNADGARVEIDAKTVLEDGTLDYSDLEEKLRNNRVKLVAVTGARNWRINARARSTSIAFGS